ncbi:MAG: phosphomannomutase/phosphoglucomutase [Bacteroidales bacterium]|nr:phosphomannomutase/phosphoglucomutase [Bacteroidales bacterium]
MKAFKAYDIRGIYNKDFDKNDVYRIGYFLSELLNTKKILIGRDVRISSDEIFESLTKGISDSGSDVYNIGISTTPMVYWSTAKYNFAASVMITASHNPKEYNGLKISKANALPVGYDTGLSDLEKMISEREIKVSDKKGKIIDFDIKNEYINFLKNYYSDISNLNICVDCSNGMAGLIIDEILYKNINYLNKALDGTFPNHEANPLNQENLIELKKEVKKNNYDIGVIFDGDADRVAFVDEKGEFISPDLMIAVLSKYFLKKGGEKVLQDIRTSKSVTEYIKANKGEMYMWRVGRAYAALKLREIDGLFGGELAGHYYFRDFYYSDSGILACLLILKTFSDFKKQGKSVSQIINEIVKYANSGEINFRTENKLNAMNAVKKHFTDIEKPTAFYDFDGYRIEFNDWWFNIRPSNTEPYLRLIVEAKTQKLLDEKLSEIKKIINNFE